MILPPPHGLFGPTPPVVEAAGTVGEEGSLALVGSHLKLGWSWHAELKAEVCSRIFLYTV